MAFDKEIAAMTIYCEASSATPAERRAVAHTILNRIRLGHGRFGATVAEVCLRRYQFSEWNDDKGDNSNLLRAARALVTESALADSIAAFAEASADWTTDPTGDATHYHDKTIAPPSWTEGATMSLETESFMFYRDVK